MSQELTIQSPQLPAAPTGATRHESLEQSLFVLFRRKWLIFGLFAAFTTAAGIAVWNRPPVHRAVTKILLKLDRGSLQIAELSPLSAKVPYSAQMMKAELELIESRDVLLPVAKSLLSWPGRSPDQIPPAEIEATIEMLSKRLVATAPGETSVIQLEFFAPTSAQAERTLSMIVDQYLEQHAVAYSGSKQLLAFYKKEKSRAQKALEGAEERVKEWEKQNDVVAIKDQITGLLTQHASLSTQLQQTESTAHVAFEENPLTSRIEGDLVSAKVELNDLLARYTEGDRRVREKKEHVALMERQLSSARGSLSSSRANERKTIESQIAQTKAALERLREKKVEGERLDRTVDINRDAFLLYGKKLEEARIANQLSREQLSSLAVIERPHATSWTDAEERVGTVLLSAIVGLSLGIVAAFVLAFFNKSLRTRRDVEAYLGLPVLATIPDLRLVGIPDLRESPS